MSSQPAAPGAAGTLRLNSPAGRWVVFAAVLGSGIAFLDSTVVNVALPTIEEDLGGGLSGLQWTVDAYLLTLSALLLLGGALGDEMGRRRVFVFGLIAFTAASILCGLAPSIGFLIGARALQGVGGAFLVPGSLSLISASFATEDRGAAVGAWSGLTGVSTAIGPFLGGWLVDSVSWRLVFLINVPLAAVAVFITLRHVPESRDPAATGHPDYLGAGAATVGLAGVVFALIEGPKEDWPIGVVLAGLIGVAALVAFPLIEARRRHPLVPLGIFRSRQFSGANATTLAVYAGLGLAMFLLVLQLQTVLGYSAIEAGSALLPITLFMLLFSARFGRLSQRIGPRLPMTIGPVVVGAGLLWLGQVGDGTSYLTGVLPAVCVLGFGLAITVAPLTAAVLAAVDDHHVGVASGVNNAVARIAGLLAVAVLPAVVGLETATSAASFTEGYERAFVIAAVLAFVGGVISWLTIRTSVPVREITQASPSFACQDPCVRERTEAA